MVQFAPEELLKTINQGKAILCLDGRGELLAFGQIWHYGQNPDGNYIKEFGSWISFKKGFGLLILEAARELHTSLYPDSSFVAIVEIDNKKAQKIIEKVSGVQSSLAYSKFLKTKNDKPALMKMYDITKKRIRI